MKKLLGIEIGGTKLQVVVGSFELEIEKNFRFAVDPSEAASGIRRNIESALRECGNSFEIAAVGVGFGGPINWKTGQVACSHHVDGWDDFSFADWLSNLTKSPIFADNDANVAALGEFRCGAGRGANPMFYVTMGSGVGGGLVVDGKIYHGLHPGESEIGHLKLDKTGRILEHSCSGWAVDRKIRNAVTDGKSPLLHSLIDDTPGNEARFLSRAIELNDRVALTILDETADDLAFGLSHVVHLMHPEKIVLGGGLSLLGEKLRQPVRNKLEKYLMEIFTPGPRVVLAELGEKAVPVGALALAKVGLSS